ncbi:MAG TPA: hypothetical protein VK338_06695 [Candidatus Nitrosocosmicus sp.]|nr:hypothetical protein [Candidatus Nitrosocosmicus sp.]
MTAKDQPQPTNEDQPTNEHTSPLSETTTAPPGTMQEWYELSAMAIKSPLAMTVRLPTLVRGRIEGSR